MNGIKDDWFHLARSAGFRLQGLTKILGLSRRQLQRRVQTELGRAPEEWLNEQRMVCARHLLMTDVPVKLIASELGYLDAAHFYHHFKSSYGMTPAEFIKFYSMKLGEISFREP